MNRNDDVCVSSPFAGPQFEAMEARLLLNSDPTFATALPDSIVFVPQGDYTLGIDGADQDADSLVLSAVSDDPLHVQVSVRQNTSYAVMHYVQRNQTTGDYLDLGDVLVQLFPDESPTAVARFITLATDHINSDGSIASIGDPYYTNLLMHRVIPGFVIQGGGVQVTTSSGTATVDSPLGSMVDQIDPNLSFAGSGVLAYANAGANTSNSEFFITEGPATHLNGGYMIFGQVINGWSTFEQVINWTTDDSDMPTADATTGYQPVLQSVTILDAGEDTQDGTVSIRPVDGWTGTTYVDVTLDDGNGGTVTQRIEVDCWQTIPSQDMFHVGVGEDFSFPVGVTTPIPSDVIWANNVSVDGASVSVGADGNLSVDLPDAFEGVFQFNLAATIQMTFPTGDPDSPTVTRQFALDSETYNGFAQLAGVPAGVGLIGDSSGGYVMDSAVVGNLLYTAAGYNGLEIYNVADPAQPIYLGGYTTSNAARTSGFARKVLVSGSTAYVAATDKGVFSLNIADPTNVTLRDQVLPGSETSSYGVQMALKGNVLFVAGYASGLVAFDVSDPGNMTSLGQVKTLADGTTSLASVVEVVLKGNYAIVSDFTQGYVVINVANPRAMKVTSVWGGLPNGTSTSPMYAPWGMELVGNRLYVVDATAATADNPNPIGFAILDVSNLSRPKILGELVIPNSPQHVVVQNETAVLGTAKDIVFIDISNPSAPTIEYTFNTLYNTTDTSNQTSKGYFVGSRFYAPSGGVGTIVFDASVYTNWTTVSKSAVIHDSANTAITVSVSGGKARLYTTGVASGDILSIHYVGTRTGKLSLNASKAFTIGDITITGSIGSLLAAKANLEGDFTATGSLGQATFADVVDGTSFLIGPRDAGDTSTQAALTFGRVADLALTSQTPIRTLTAVEWLDSNTPETLTAPSIGTIRTTGQRANPRLLLDQLAGDFQPGLNLSGTGTVLGSATIAGSKSGSWQAPNGTIKSVTARGAFTGDLAANSIGTVSVTGSLTNSAISASLIGSVTLQGSLTDASLTGDSAKSITVKGNLDNSDITIGSLATLGVQGSLTGSDFTIGALGTVTVRGNLTDSTFTANSIKTLSVQGSLAGTHVSAQTVSVLSVNGDADGLVLALEAPYADKAFVLTQLSVRRWLRNSAVTALGSIGTVKAGGMDHTDITVGLAAMPAPGDPYEFIAGNNAMIRSATVSGMKQGSTLLDSFIASNIVAPLLGSVTTNCFQRTVGQGNFGLAATYIASWSGSFIQNGKAVTARGSKLDDPSKSLAFDDFQVLVV